MVNCFQALLSSFAFKLCFQALLSRFAFKLCFQALRSSFAFKLCFQALLSSFAFNLCFQSLLSSFAFKLCFQDLLSSFAVKICFQIQLAPLHLGHMTAHEMEKSAPDDGEDEDYAEFEVGLTVHMSTFRLDVTAFCWVHWEVSVTKTAQVGLSVGMTSRAYLLESRVYLLKDRDPVALSASRSAGFPKCTVLIGRTGFDTRPDTEFEKRVD